MKLHLKALSGAAVILLSLQACSKSGNNPGGSGSISKGQAAIELTSSTSIAGKSNLKSNMNAQSLCTKGAGLVANTEMYTLTTTQVDGLNLISFQLTITVAKGATTNSGNITGAFGGNGAAISTMIFGGGTLNGTQTNFGITSGGTVTITKLTADSIEGTFSGQGKNQSNNTTTTVTDGKFAGKF